MFIPTGMNSDPLVISGDSHCRHYQQHLHDGGLVGGGSQSQLECYAAVWAGAVGRGNIVSPSRFSVPGVNLVLQPVRATVSPREKECY